MKRYLAMCLLMIVAPLSECQSESTVTKEESSALMSKNCDEKKIRELAGDAIVKIVAQDWGAEMKGFNVTINAGKMSMKELTDKMQAAKCF